jgi:hypothetical protein
MSKSCCFTCKAHTVVKCCSKCQAVYYCSKSCQKEDWKQHKQICQFLNVGDGAVQFQIDDHMVRYAHSQDFFETSERRFDKDEDGKRFFKLFTASTLDGSQAAAREMKKIAARQTKSSQKAMLFHSLSILMRTDPKKLPWPNSPLRIMLEFVDANVRREDSGQELATGPTPLHHLTYEANPKDHTFHRNQVILGRQLFRHGANANLDAYKAGLTPLHQACHSISVTNLDFIQLLLERGANPNAQDVDGMTPVMSAIPMAPGAAKFLLEWSPTPPSTTDIHIPERTRVTSLGWIHSAMEIFSNRAASHDDPHERVMANFVLQQWREIETMLVEMGSD